MPLHVRAQNVRQVRDRVMLDLVCDGEQPAGGIEGIGPMATLSSPWCLAEADKRGYRVHGREQAEILVERA